MLSQIDDQGHEKPIEYISRTPSKAEKNYSQIDREALAIVWAVGKFHVYLYGVKFLLMTDHKPLVYIFDKVNQSIKNKKIPEMTNNRISRYAVTLMMYNYEIKYRNTKEHANCDMLTRLPAPMKDQSETISKYDVVFAVTLEEAMLNSETVIKETRKDPVLSKVYHYTLDGWPSKIDTVNE